MATPHRVLDSIADGVVDGVKSLFDAGASAFKSAGETIMGGLDKPFAAITGKEGPHRIVDRLADGALNTVTGFVDNGIIAGAKNAGEAVMKALDHPPEQIGIPPDIETMRLFKK